MMNRKPLLLAVLLALAGAGIAHAQTAPKLYRWVDKQGKVHYDQALPVEAVDQARREFNTKTGNATGSVDRALTPEERAQQAAAAQAAFAAGAAAGEQKRQEDIMMASYASEADLTRAYSERIALLKLTKEATELSIKSLSENLVTILAQASDAELGKRKIMDERVQTIREMHAEKLKQQAFQLSRTAELDALNAEYARMLSRYRELRAARAAPAAELAPAPATPPTP